LSADVSGVIHVFGERRAYINHEPNRTFLQTEEIHDSRRRKQRLVPCDVVITWVGAVALFLIIVLVIIAALFVFLALVERKRDILIT
jgi:hypothetical protein